MSTNTPKPETAPMFIDGKALAQLVSLTPRWVELNRHRIIGAQKIGSVWRYHRDIILRTLASGKNIIIS